ncbi:MAG: adenylate kinase [Chloroflexota bacterium]
MNLVLLGPPGAGKGTQAEMLARAFGLVHVDTGQSLRDAAQTDTPVGKYARNLLGRGMLLPDDLVAQVIEDKLRGVPPTQGFVLDGFPRTLVQARMFDDMLRRLNRSLSAVIALLVDESTVLERLAGRRVCPRCREVYHIRFRPPRKPGICDICQTPFEQRPDDRPEAIRRRLELYHRETEPVLDFYRSRGLLREIDANRSPSEVLASIRDMLSRSGLTRAA